MKDEAPLRQRFIGVKVHGIGNYVYVVDESVPGGSNLIIEILNRVLAHLDASGKLPSDPQSVLYLQVDNCGENKNRTMFAYLTDLVRRDVFFKVKASFLMVGHTHEDIDQFFSVISKHLKQLHVNCPDQQSLFAEMKKAFSKVDDVPEIFTFLATEMFDYCAFYDPVIDSEISYHQEPHVFCIKQFVISNGPPVQVVTLVHYKMWAESSVWLPAIEPENEVLGVENLPALECVGPTGQGASKKRKMQVGMLTKGQKAACTKPAKNLFAMRQSKPCHDIQENQPFQIDAVSGVFVDDIPSSQCRTIQPVASKGHLRGIPWICDSPCSSTAHRILFSPEVMATNAKRSLKIHTAIRTNFASKYKSLFTTEVLKNWDSWLVLQQELWIFGGSPTVQDTLCFPCDISIRRLLLDEAEEQPAEIEDCTLADLPDEQETKTFDGGEFGSFSKQQRLEMVRLILAEIDSFNEKAMVYENMFCIYRFEHEDID